MWYNIRVLKRQYKGRFSASLVFVCAETESIEAQLIRQNAGHGARDRQICKISALLAFSPLSSSAKNFDRLRIGSENRILFPIGVWRSW